MLDSFDHHIVSVDGQRFEVLWIRSQHCSSGFGAGDHQSINRGAPSSPSSEGGRSTSERFRNGLGDLAGLEKPVFVGVSTRVSLQTFHENDRGDSRRPKTLFPKGKNQRQRFSRALGKAADRPGIEDEHQTLSGLAMSTSDYSARDVGRTCALSSRRRTHLSLEVRGVGLARAQQLPAAHLGTDSILQEFRSRQTTVLYQLIEIIGEVDLHARHTPKYTPIVSVAKPTRPVIP